MLPAAIAVTPLESPETSTGTELLVVVPFRQPPEGVGAPALDLCAAGSSGRSSGRILAGVDRRSRPLESPDDVSRDRSWGSVLVPFPSAPV